MRKKGAWPATVPGHGGHGSGGVALTRCVAGGGEIERGNERDEEADWWTGLGVGSACQRRKESGREKAGGPDVFKIQFKFQI
jgi:hypothetical protein